MKLNQRRVAAFAIVAALVCLAVFGVVIWRVESALDSSKRDAAKQELLDFEVRTLGAQPNPGFEGLLAPAVYKSTAVFEGRIYLAGPAGLYAYAADGTLEHIYRTGIDRKSTRLNSSHLGISCAVFCLK